MLIHGNYPSQKDIALCAAFNVTAEAPVARMLRWFLVTPDMHRVHHSIVRRETDSNFGFNLPWWDRLFRTYRAEPEAGHDNMTLGLAQFREEKELRIDRMLTQPFRNQSIDIKSELKVDR